jgi:rhodanese-related sulfurtransferase
MNTNKKEYFFLDVREEEEFIQDFIPNSLNMPVRKVLSVGYGFSNGFWEQMIPKNKVLVLYCSTGKRAKMAEQALKEKHYKTKNAHTLEEAKKFYNTIAN